MKSVQFTNHALRRLDERSALSQKEIIEFVQSDKVVHIARYYSKEYLLLYSIIDNDFFILILVNNNLVITIIPAIFSRLQLLPEACIEAIQLVNPGLLEASKQTGLVTLGEPWIITQHLNNRHKGIFIGTFTPTPGIPLEDAFTSEALKSWLINIVTVPFGIFRIKTFEAGVQTLGKSVHWEVFRAIINKISCA
jgi:hypothetical protein